MVILKKLKASSLLETLTASVIIVILFMIASFSFNNVFLNSIKSDDTSLKNRIQEITYFLKHDELNLPFYEDEEYWTISGERKGDKAYFKIQNKRNTKKYNLSISVEE
jgi:uncharacterized protein YpmB